MCVCVCVCVSSTRLSLKGENRPARVITGPNGAANGFVGTGFASRYRLQPRAGFLKAQWVGV